MTLNSLAVSLCCLGSLRFKAKHKRATLRFTLLAWSLQGCTVQNLESDAQRA